MSALIGFTLLLVFQVLGEGLAKWFRLELPGPVIGLMLLWPSLYHPWIRVHVQAVAGFLLSNLSLLFIPVGVGVILHLDVLTTVWWQIALSLLISTVFGLVVTLYLLRVLIRHFEERSSEGTTGDD